MFMNKTPKLFILAGTVLASIFLFVSIVYNNFVQKSIYEKIPSICCLLMSR